MAERIELVIGMTGGKEAISELESIKRYAKELNGKKVDVHLNVHDSIVQLRQLGDAINVVSGAFHGLASLSSGAADFADAIGNAFGGMSDLFSFDAVDTIGKTLTVLGTKAIAGNLDKIRSRFDIMSTFAEYMELAGVSANEANKALQRVNESILGLPIGLDESAQRLRRYQMFMDDLGAATNLTIGVQKAITAGGANAQMKNYAYTQIDRLLTSGELTQARQWFSLMNGLGVSMRYVREAMGVLDMSNADLAAGLVSGTISTESFLQALQDLGEGSSDAAQHLDRALEIYKGTLESWLSNIQFAAIRGGETVLKALNNTLQDSTGKPIVGYLEIVRDSMNDVYRGIGSYITEHPEQLSGTVDMIERFANVLGRFSASDIVTKGYENLQNLFGWIIDAIKDLPTDKTEDFIAFSTTLAGPLSKFFKAMSNGLPTLIGVFERFNGFDFGPLIEKTIDYAGDFADAVAKILGVFDDETMTNVIAFGLVWGRPLAAVLDAVGNGFGYLANTLYGLANPRYGTTLSRIIAFGKANPELAAAAGQLLALAGGVAAFAGAIAAVYKSTTKVDQDWINDYFDFEAVEEGIEKTEKINREYQDLLKGWDEDVSNIQAKYQTARDLFKQLNELNEQLEGTPEGARRDSIIEKEVTALQEIQNLLPDIPGSIDIITGAWDESLNKVNANYQAVLNYMQGVEMAKAASRKMEEIYDFQIDAMVQKTANDEIIADAKRKLDELQDQLNNLEQPDLDAGINAPGVKEYRETVNTLTTAMQEIKASIAPYEEENTGLTESIKNAEVQLRALQSVVDSLSGPASETVQNALAGTVKSIDDVATSLGMTKEAVEDLKDSFDDLLEAVNKSIGGIVSGFGEMDEIEATTLEQMTQNVAAQVQFLENLQKNIDTLETFVSEYDASDGLKQAISEMLASPGDYAAEISVLADEVGKAMASGTQDAFKDLDIFGNLVEEKNSLINEDSLRAAALSTVSSFGEAILKVAEEEPQLFGGAFDTLLEKWVPDEEKIGMMADTFTKALVPPEETVQSAEEAYAAVTQAAEETRLKIGGDEGSLDGAVLTLQGDINTFNEETMPALQQILDESGRTIQDFVDNPLENMRQKLDGGDGSVSYAVASLNGEIVELGECMVARANNEFVQFNATLINMESYFNSAATAAANLAEEIRNLASVQTNMDLPGTVESSVPFPAGSGVYQARGGPVYLAKGGFGFFRPRGTDTVPAMLTPGEFVVRKKAVDRIGAGVLSMINRMDIPNAIDALMSKVHMPLGHQFVTYDNRKSYDNHATVNQNIYTQNPSFTYRRASRFAHAL